RVGHDGEKALIATHATHVLRRPVAPSAASMSPAGSNWSHQPKGPKNKNPSERTVIMGPLVKESGLPPSAFDPNSSVDAALARLLQGIRQGRGSGDDGAKRDS